MLQMGICCNVAAERVYRAATIMGLLNAQNVHPCRMHGAWNALKAKPIRRFTPAHSTKIFFRAKGALSA
jgi:hypothetical protein